jgi:transcription initiation factor TFIIIB Brf1 subunit/transcription initiation factor TFIIB
MTDIDFKKLNELVLEKKEDDEINKNICSHNKIILQGMNSICEDCGEIVSKNFSYEREWRYYGSMDTRHNSDPNRCNIRRVDDKGIFKDVEKYQINPRIINTANEIYETVTNSKIYRGNTRKGIVFACVYHAYNINQNPQSCKNLIQIFDMEQKVALKGLKFVNLNLPIKSSIRGDNSSNEVKHLIQEIMNQFNATEQQIIDVHKLYEHLMNRSSLLNRSRPQSVAYGLVCYYIMKKNPDYSIDYFKEKIKLSELTLTRIVREIETIIS